MNGKAQIFSKIFALLMVGLFFGTSMAVMAEPDDGGNDDEREEYNVWLFMDETERRIAPGGTARYKGIIQNVGSKADRYEITFGGKDYGLEGVTVELISPVNDQAVDPFNLSLKAGEEFIFVLHITIERDEGTYEIAMMVRSKSDENVWDAVKTKTTVVPDVEYDFALKAVETRKITTYGVPVTYSMYLYNTGNVEDTYEITMEFAEEYPNVRATFVFLRPDDTTELTAENDATRLKFSLDPGEWRHFGLRVLVMEPKEPMEPGAGARGIGAKNVGTGIDPDVTHVEPIDVTKLERYVIKVIGQSRGDPDLQQSVKTVTYIKDEPQERLDFVCYDTDKTIRAGGVAEYFMYLINYGHTPVKVKFDILDYNYTDIEAELFIIIPYWLMENEKPYVPGYDMDSGGYLYASDWDYYFAESGNGENIEKLMGDMLSIYDENGNLTYLDEDDIVWEDYGGLVPVRDDYTYVLGGSTQEFTDDYPGNVPGSYAADPGSRTDDESCYHPYSQIDLLLRVTHHNDMNTTGIDPNGTVPDSKFYDISVSAKSEGGFHEVITTTTEVVFKPRYGIEMRPPEAKKITRPQQPVQYVFSLRNTGTVEEVVELSISGEAWGLEGVYAYLYAMNDWDPADDVPYPEPIVVYDENGNKRFNQNYDEGFDGFGDDLNYGDFDSWDYENFGEDRKNYEDPIWRPEPLPDKLKVHLDRGEEIKIMLWVMIYYESGVYNLNVDGVVVGHPATAKVVKTYTIVKDGGYDGFKVFVPYTERSAEYGEKVDYYICIYNPSYYTDVIQLELGGKHLHYPGVEAQLFIKKNVYYYEPGNDEFLREHNPDLLMEFGGATYDPNHMGEREIEEKYPDFYEGNLPWYDGSRDDDWKMTGEMNGASGRRGNSGDDGTDPEEYYFDNTGMAYKNYDYERRSWEKPEDQFDEDDWLVPVVGDRRWIKLGPFEFVWLVLRVVVNDVGMENLDNQTGLERDAAGAYVAPRVFNIDVIAQSVFYPEYKETISTYTHIKDTPNYGLDLFIGDPVHYTAYGITTVYVFQLTNTGDVRDRIGLGVDGPDAQLPNVHIEIGIQGEDSGEPVIMRDDYGNILLPYDPTGDYVDEKYRYDQWARNDDTDFNESLFGRDGGEDQEFKKRLATIDGELVDENHTWETDADDDDIIFLRPEYNPLTNSWGPCSDVSGIPSGVPDSSMNVGWWGSCDKKNGVYDLDRDFIPYDLFQDKCVELEAGETVYVVMKVTINDPDGIDREVRQYNKDHYEIILVARSKGDPDVVERERTLTYIYDESIQNGIRDQKVSGIFNVVDRSLSMAILEEGFEILPTVIESGRVEFRVRANFSGGRLLVLNLNESNIRELGDFEVLFDKLVIDRMDPERIVDYTGTKARYALLKVADGTQLMVYIPHFSEHTIEVRSVSSETEKDTGFSGSMLMGGIALGVAFGLVSFGYYQKRDRARKNDFKLKLHETGGPVFTPITASEAGSETGKKDDLEKLLNESLFFDNFEKKM